MNNNKILLRKFELGIQSWLDFEKYLNLNAEEVEPFLQLASTLKSRNFNDVIKIYTPGSRFPAISITGDECALNCSHCNKKFLKSMHPITNKENLKSFLLDLAHKGGTGALISGGCLPDGSVPLLEYIDIIKEIKKDTKLIINIHTGLLNEKIAQMLAEAKVDIVSFDFNLDNEIIQNIYHLNKDFKDYIQALNILKSYGLNVIPHICVGLFYGKLHKELESIKYLKTSGFNPSLIVLIALIPPDDSKGKFVAPNPIDLAKIISILRFIFPKTEISLGCMRPRGNLKIEIEKLAIKAGINRIEIPSKKTLYWVKKRFPNTILEYYSACCAIPQGLEHSAKSKDKSIKRYQF
ncbi:MAG: radical SAM protein [Candidatus Thorarchaeota archaeon]